MTTGSHLPELTAGMIIANRFRLERILGQGGMGSVWVAHHLTLNIAVAVKFVDPTLAARDEVRSRFAQEAQSAAKINSPHVVRMVDYGTDEHARPYIAMELLHGEELGKRLEREPVMALRDVARLLTQACRGLTKAHQAGVTHRDLKPENLFLTEDDDGFAVKILDFGIAKAGSPIGGLSHRTGTGQLVGTPTYMSPEQALGTGNIDSRSDLYSLAVVAYRCVTGRVPFASAGLGELIVAITSRPHTPPSSQRAEATTAIDAWFARGMAKEPGERFATAREMADAFQIACGFSTISGAFGPGAATPESRQAPPPYAAPSLGGALGGKPATLLSSASTHDDDAPVVPKRSLAPLVLAGAAFLGLALMAYAWTRGAAPAPSPLPAALSDARPLSPPAPAGSSTPPIAVAPPPPAPPASASVAPPAAPPASSFKGKTGTPGDRAKPDDKIAKPPSPPPPPGPKDYGL